MRRLTPIPFFSSSSYLIIFSYFKTKKKMKQTFTSSWNSTEVSQISAARAFLSFFPAYVNALEIITHTRKDKIYGT
jgi:hypothetical protein